MNMTFERLLFEAIICPRCDFPSPKNKNDGESYIKWYNSLAPSIVHVLTYCSSGCSRWYPRTFKGLFSPSWSIATMENYIQHRGFRALKGEEEDTPEQFRRVRLISWHYDAARTRSQKIYVDLSAVVFEDFEFSPPGV